MIFLMIKISLYLCGRDYFTVTTMNSHQRFASFEPDPKNAVFDLMLPKKNSTPSCTMTSGPRSNASGELVRTITPKPSSSGGQTACDMEKVSESDRGASYVSPSPESARRLRTRSSVLNIYFSSWVMSLAKCKLGEYVSIGNGFDWSALIKNKSKGKSDRSRTLNSPVVTFFLRIPTSRMQ